MKVNNDIAIINGHKYSKERFDDYKLRLKVEVYSPISDSIYKFDIYTTETNIDVAKEMITDGFTGRIYKAIITYTATKERDEAESALLKI